MVRLSIILSFVVGVSIAQPGWPDELLLVPEKTNYEKTSAYADVMSFLSAQSAKSKDIRLITMGRSPEGKAIPVAILAHPMVNSAEEARSSGKLIVYIQGNIHAGEVEGKEVVLMQIRSILGDPTVTLLDNLVILFAPIYNTDSNDKMAFGRRPTQENSPPEVGIRENSQGLDLNRDGVKMEANETNGLFGLINEWDPQLFVDLHTTNGSWHGWNLTWAPSYHTAGDKGPYDFTMKMLKDITNIVPEKHNRKFGPYGDYYLSEGWPATNFYTYNHHPRYLVNQFGLRNRMAILSEAFSHEPFKERIYSTNAFVTEILQYASDHANDIKSINKAAEASTVSLYSQQAGKVKKGVSFKMVASEVLNNMPSYTYEMDPVSKRYVHGNRRMTLDNVNYYGGFQALEESTIPSGYIIPKQFTAVVENLKKHGVRVDVLKRSKAFSGDVFQMEKFETAQRPFEGHKMATATGKFVATSKRFKKGDFVVDLSQPLGNLAFYLLEPQSDDGLLTWNFFDESVEKQKKQNSPIEYPVFRYYSNK